MIQLETPNNLKDTMSHENCHCEICGNYATTFTARWLVRYNVQRLTGVDRIPNTWRNPGRPKFSFFT